MATIRQRIDTTHRDAIHDAQLNLYGSRLATCGSDRLVKIFEVRPNGQSFPIAELAGHSGPVWKVSWAHPKFGGLLASAAYDKKVIIWQETSGRWHKSHEWAAHEASATSVAFAPSQYGLILASSAVDGEIGLLVYDAATSQWTSSKISKAHDQGVNSVSWAPALVAAGGEETPKRLASAGNDKNVKIWVEGENGEWHCEKTLHGHTDFVRDVAWCPVVNHTTYTLVSCGLDGNLVLYRTKNITSGEWTVKLLEKSNGALFHVSWSPCGGFFCRFLAMIIRFRSGGKNFQGQWTKVDRDNKEKGRHSKTSRRDSFQPRRDAPVNLIKLFQGVYGSQKKMALTCSDIPKFICALLLPPIGVWMEKGCGAQLVINILLTLLGYIPGIIHACIVILWY
ncbi:unnamed protein product [Caenorhabditis auriculariae]|uniref:Protein SEC13 homolog n=1 Tax=Caenorhabditis auriculariae TaxID=2777116 RepID=A0A8S1HNL3_9PELO|nr:unnamed protein product [Caenorhabditis auriculariae]